MTIAIYTYIFTINTIAFFLYYIDKTRACENRRRISNATLLALAWIGGAYGAIMGMTMFRHKTRSKSYHINVPLALLIWGVAIILMRIL